jgi:hypothetical protein
MKPYDTNKQKERLEKLNAELQPHEKALIAGFEKCSTVTVTNYLKGDITVPALAQAIIDRANAIIKNR